MDALKELSGNKALIVTGGSSMKRFGFIEQTQCLLAEAEIESAVYDGVEPNPSVQTVRKGAQMMKEFKPDWIVAIGGGSALDAAKIMWFFYQHPHLCFEDIIPVGSMPALRNKAKFIAIPSTSGTASENTAFSVITDTKNHIKYPVVSSFIVPELGLVHSLSHKIGGEFAITHGLANAILLPYIIEYNKLSTNKYVEFEKYMGIACIEDELRKLNAKLGIPLTNKEVDEVEVNEAAYLYVLDRMSDNAFNDPCTLTNPGTPTVADVKEIYRKAYYGE